MINRFLQREAPKPGRTGALGFTGLLLLSLPFSGLAQQGGARIERTIDAALAPRISLTNLTGHVVVKGWDKLQIRVVSTTTSSRVDVEMETMPSKGPAEKLRLETHARESTLSAKERITDYLLEVPLASSLDLHNFEGDVQVQRLQGDVGIESGGAPIEVDDVSGHLAVRSLAGDIRISRSAGRVEANSVCGNLYFISPTGTDLRAGTTSGKIVFEGDFVPAADYQLSTWNGNMDVFTSPTGSFELVAKSIKGKVVRDPEVPLRSKPRRPTSVVPGYAWTANAGQATVELNSFSGSIHINPLSHRDNDGR
ncbi:MAG: DUF4097 family beta strand repeat-containing protein [Terriglobia bacterium]